jgi:hypothetical protein
MDEVERILQSHEEFTFDDLIAIHFIHTEFPHGGHNPRPIRDTSSFKKACRGILQISNKDNLCLGRAIAVSKAIADGIDVTDKKLWNKLRKNTTTQKTYARELFQQAGIEPGVCAQEEFAKFQMALLDYQFIVTSKKALNAIVYKGPEANKKIIVYHSDRHFDAIRTLPKFYNRTFYCVRCEKGYNDRKNHRCEVKCSSCHRPDCPVDEWTLCQKCNRCFPSQDCYDFHLKKSAVKEVKKGEKKAKLGGMSICDKKYKCLECKRVVDRSIRDDVHRCGERYCFICSKFVLPDHLCYIQTEGQNEKKRNRKKQQKNKTGNQSNDQVYITFDYECMLDPETGDHRPNAVIAHRTCSTCFSKAREEFCDNCYVEEFKTTNCNDEFCKWVLKQEGAIVICHNFKSYDSYFIMQYLYDRAVVPDVIMNGMKIMTMTVSRVKFIDSLNFLPMALRQLPPTFGLEEEVRKGYFPHLFNTPQNQDYEGPYPDQEYFDPDSMAPKQREDFVKWYQANKGNIFNLLDELYAYCRSDVDVLRHCCAKFQAIFKDICDIDPFQHCITIASTCNLVYRKMFLKPDTIAVIPPLGYRPHDQCSQKAIAWLKWVAHKEGIEIQYALNQGERRIGTYKVDGFQGNTVYEFLGDLWHGCPICYKDRAVKNPINDTAMGDLYEAWIRKEKYMKSQNYTVVAIWECQFEQQLKQDPEMCKFVKELKQVSPLEPRDAFYGGRTNATCLYAVADENETIRYVDVCSLYPWVNKYCTYPIHHPTILTENLTCDIKQYEGLLKCSVLPPRKLYHPVLPYRSNGKLMFTLCATCADTLAQTPCNHSDTERSLAGTWVSVELQKACDLGYKVMEVYEVWHFTDTSSELFNGYIDTFLKLKQESSKLPNWCKTAEDVAQYKAQYAEHEGINLGAIKFNAGRRALAKLMLNSMWGFFGKRSGLGKTEYISKPERYFALLTDPRVDVKNIDLVNEEVAKVHYVEEKAFRKDNKNTNVIIAAYTTAHARLKLYSILELLQERVLYYDTDSVVYRHREDLLNPPTGSYLGDLTDELDGDTIHTFVSGGPKNYAYSLVKSEKTCCKVKGFTLNHRSSKKINFKTMVELVTVNPAQKIPIDQPHQIRRQKDMRIYSKNERKEYRLVYNKRVLIPDTYNTLPYGY